MENLEQTALFINATNEAFTGYWNSQAYEFGPAGSKDKPDRLYMEAWKAHHFAKHLTNRELMKVDGGETHTSPKNPEQDPMFMELFNKFVIVQGDSTESKVHSDVINMNEGLSSDIEPPKNKGGRPKKIETEEEFEGLNE